MYENYKTFMQRKKIVYTLLCEGEEEEEKIVHI